jgi:hypothetical protein
MKKELPLVVAALLVSLAVLAGCGGAGKPVMRSVQFQIWGGDQEIRSLFDNQFPYLTIINGDMENGLTDNLPWTSKAIQLKAGSQVTISLAMAAEYTSPITCEIISDGRVVAKASATNLGPDCSARV